MAKSHTKILLIALAIMLCLSMALLGITFVSNSEPAYAESANYTLYLKNNGVKIGSATGSNYSSSAFYYSSTDGAYVMENFNFTTSASIGIKLSQNATIILKGTNNITVSENDSVSYGIDGGSSYSLTISKNSTGILNVTTAKVTAEGAAIYGANLKSLTVSGGTLNLTAGDSKYTTYGLKLSLTGEAVINGGNLNITAEEIETENYNANNYGISGDVSVSAGSLKVLSQNATALSSGKGAASYGIDGDLTVSGGNVAITSGDTTATATGTAGNAFSHGVSGKVTITGGVTYILSGVAKNNAAGGSATSVGAEGTTKITAGTFCSFGNDSAVTGGKFTATGCTVRASDSLTGTMKSTYTSEKYVWVNFIPVTDITGVKSEIASGESYTLPTAVTPTNATNSTIVWTVKNAGTTGASITGGTLSTTAGGTVVVTGTVVNGSYSTDTTKTAALVDFTKDFSITVTNASYVAVTDISDVPTQATAGEGLTLSGTVAPTNATNQTIAWTIKNNGGDTSAAISEGVLTATKAGTIKVTATITNGATQSTDYTEDFEIDVYEAVTDITLADNKATAGVAFTLSGTVSTTTATNKTITWTIKDNGGDTSAAISEGALTATKGGKIKVTATITNGKSRTENYTKDFEIDVYEAVTDITLADDKATAGVAFTLSGTVTTTTATNKTIAWTIKDNGGDTSAAISEGALTATKSGKIKVTATVTNGKSRTENYTKDFEIDVYEAVTDITINDDKATAGVAFTLSGTVTTTTATNQTIAWAIKDKGGDTDATLTEGVLTATKSGKITVTAIVVNGATRSTGFNKDFEIDVYEAVTDIELEDNKATAGEEFELSGTVTTETATNQTITWTIKDNGGDDDATISDGVLTATKSGTIKVTATVVNGATRTTDYTEDFEIDVYEAVTGIELEDNEATAGEEFTLSGTVTNETATNSTILWTIKDNGGDEDAEITEGVLTATKSGTIKVTATVTNGKTRTTDYTEDFEIDVYEAVVDIELEDDEATAGEEFTLSGTVSTETATNSEITWTIKDNGGDEDATISDGVLTATKSGTIKVTATVVNGATRTTDYTEDFDIDVYEAVTLISDVPTQVILGKALTLVGTVTSATATNQDIVWSVGEGTGATIDGSSLTVTKDGTITVTATIVNGATRTTDYTQNFDLTVFVPVTDIAAVPFEAIIGVELDLVGTVYPENATNKTITWEIVDAGETGAIILNDKLSASAVGNIKIKATIADGKAPGEDFVGEFNVVSLLNAIPVDGISISNNEITIMVNDEITLEASVRPSDATNKALIWTSSDNSIATVLDGKIVGRKAGTATITVTSEDGSFTATCIVNVTEKEVDNSLYALIIALCLLLFVVAITVIICLLVVVPYKKRKAKEEEAAQMNELAKFNDKQ